MAELAEVQVAAELKASMRAMATEFPHETYLVALLTQVLASEAQTEV